MVKDSYKVKGMIVVCGLLVFKEFVVNEDVFIVVVIWVEGGILIGRINMLFMVYGGMQCGIYG